MGIVFEEMTAKVEASEPQPGNPEPGPNAEAPAPRILREVEALLEVRRHRAERRRAD